MSRYLLRTFGGLTLERDGQPVDAITGQRRALGLMAAIAAAGPAGLTRDRAMLLLWPESNTERAKGSLKQLLHEIRRRLDGPETITGVAELRLNQAAIDSDVIEFRDAVRAGDDALAVRLYRDPFLDGVHLSDADEFERWVEDERAELARLHAAALERLATRAERAGHVREALDAWQRLHAIDRLNARVILGLMRALSAARDTAAALRQAELYIAAVERELGAAPDPAVLSLAEELRQPRTSPLPESPAEIEGPRSTKRIPAPEAPATGTRHGRSPRRRAFTAAVAALAAVVVLLIVLFRSVILPPSTDEALRPDRVAVAIFTNRTGARELDGLGIMASDWVTRGLLRSLRFDVIDIGGLYVSGRERGGEPADPRVLARRTGAGLVVAGNYYRSGDSLTFSAQVIDVASGRVLRAIEPIHSTVDQPLEAVEEVRQRTATALGTILDLRTAAFAEVSPVIPPRYDAFEAYVRGQELFWRGDWAGSLPHFLTAAQLDTSFIPALTFVSLAGVGTARCDLADSVLAVFESRTDVPEMEMLTARTSVARCASDHAEHNRLHRLRAALAPRSKWIQLTMSTGFRQMNQPGEALAILADIDPVRDLGWLPEGGYSFYWREIAANQHALGEYRAERATADRMLRFDAAPLAIAFFRARSFAALGMVDSALATILRIADTPPDPAMIAGVTGALDARDLAVPGWVMFQTALELDAHGHTDAAQVAIQHCIAWYTRAGAASTMSFTRRIVLARAWSFAGQHLRARALLEQLVVENPASVDAHGLLGQTALRSSDERTAAAADAWLERQTDVFPPGLPRFYRATLAAIRGEPQRALDLLESLPSRAHPHDFLQFHVDAALASLRAEPRFRAILTPRS